MKKDHQAFRTILAAMQREGDLFPGLDLGKQIDAPATGNVILNFDTRVVDREAIQHEQDSVRGQVIEGHTDTDNPAPQSPARLPAKQGAV
jgi:hypothetical protein